MVTIEKNHYCDKSSRLLKTSTLVWITEAPTLISFTVKMSEPNVYEQKPI